MTCARTLIRTMLFLSMNIDLLFCACSTTNLWQCHLGGGGGGINHQFIIPVVIVFV